MICGGGVGLCGPHIRNIIILLEGTDIISKTTLIILLGVISTG